MKCDSFLLLHNRWSEGYLIFEDVNDVTSFVCFRNMGVKPVVAHGGCEYFSRGKNVAVGVTFAVNIIDEIGTSGERNGNNTVFRKIYCP